MKAFYVYHKIKSKALLPEKAEFVYLSSSFSFSAFFFSHFWLAFHRMWGFLAIFMLFEVLVYKISMVLEPSASFVLTGIPSFFLGTFAHQIREKHLLRSGYKLYAILMAENITVAQLRLFREMGHFI
ncbi:DUF2628 domain-containing protein [Neorickettsia sp. 179522]|uniref:DUF2628 domain-containing protein n=1 Tax=Neorickettsia sp. 179522 TaxID=1714371 RepID=UPI0007945986|nr:DUF2628 domain-containing protein [Neorickettsia sp. 179522]KYH12498.1 hypothetical protein AS219_01650 [Neorickettsia sp. 179522]